MQFKIFIFHEKIYRSNNHHNISKMTYVKQKHLNNVRKCLNLMCSLKNLLWKKGKASTITSFLKRLKRLNKILKTLKLVELLPLFIKFLSFFKNFSKFCGNASSKQSFKKYGNASKKSGNNSTNRVFKNTETPQIFCGKTSKKKRKPLN